MIKITLVRTNRKFTLNKLLVGSIYLEASQSIVVDLKQHQHLKINVLKILINLLKTET